MSIPILTTGARIALLVLFAGAGLLSCQGPAEKEELAPPPPAPREGELFRVGTLIVYKADLARHLQDRYRGRDDEQTRQSALKDLAQRAQFAQAALEAGLADDPIFRNEAGRLLEARLRETELNPKLQAEAEISPERLRELYQSQLSRFQASEKRQVAVLWLDSGPDPAKAARYAEKLGQAREFALQSQDIVDHPEKGFSILGADYSEHSASRFRGGVVGWLEPKGGLDSWTKAVAEIAFGIEEKGGLSEVTIRPEGVFLVRVMDLKPALTRPFESVAAELERAERTRLRQQIEDQFKQKIEADYPVQWPAK